MEVLPATRSTSPDAVNTQITNFEGLQHMGQASHFVLVDEHSLAVS
jgi:hypothetical protein